MESAIGLDLLSARTRQLVSGEEVDVRVMQGSGYEGEARERGVMVMRESGVEGDAKEWV